MLQDFLFEGSVANWSYLIKYKENALFWGDKKLSISIYKCKFLTKRTLSVFLNFEIYNIPTVVRPPLIELEYCQINNEIVKYYH